MSIPKSKRKDLEILRYTWRNGFPSYKVDAEAAAVELNRIKAKKGTVNAHVVAAAVTKRSVLAPLLEFDSAKALTDLRVRQAGDLLGALRAVILHGDEEYEVAYLHPIRLDTVDAEGDEQEERAYLSITEVREDEDATAQVLRGARRELESWRQRYQTLEAVFGIKKAIPQVTRAIQILEKSENGIQPQAGQGTAM